jgi:hypothetical protein
MAPLLGQYWWECRGGSRSALSVKLSIDLTGI